MADKDIGGIKFTVGGDDSGLKRIDESMEGLQQTAKDTQQAIDKYGNALTEADKKAGRFIDKAGRMREANGQFVKSVELAERKTGALGDTSTKTAKDLDKLKAEVKENGDALKTAAGYATAFTAAVGSVTAIAAKAAKELNNMSKLSGTTVEDFQKLAFGANEVGISTEKLGDIFKDTQDKIGDYLNTGGGELKDYFENIAPLVGQTAEQFRGLSGPQALGLFQQGLEKANLTAAEQIFYLESLANDASLLSPLLANNGQGFSDAAKRMEELNLVLSQAEVDNLVKVDKAFNELGTTISKNTQKIVAENAEEIVDAIQSVSETIASLSNIINENMDTIVKAAKIIGSATAAWYGYRTAVLLATAAQTAFNVAAKANPIGILVTVLGTAAGAFMAFSDGANDAKNRIDELTASTQKLSKAERERFIADATEEAVNLQMALNEALVEQARLKEKAKKNTSSGQLLGGVGSSAELLAANAQVDKLQSQYDKVIASIATAKEEQARLTVEINKGAGTLSDGLSEADKALEALLKKYPQLVDEEQQLLEEQLLLNAALETAGDDQIPAILAALEQVRKKLQDIRNENKNSPLVPVVGSDGSSGLSIFDQGANTADDFSDVFVDNLSPALKKELGVQAKTFGQVFGETLDKLDWSQYGGQIGMSLGEALVTGDSGALKGALSGAVGNITSDALTPALTSAFGAGAAAFLGPLAGGIAGSVISGLGSSTEEIDRTIRLAVSDGVAKGFEDVDYLKTSLFSSSEFTRTFGLSDQQNSQINQSLEQLFGNIDDQLENLGATVSDFSGEFEGGTISDAINSAADQYVDAGFEFIEDFQRVGESLTDAFERVSGMIGDVTSGLDNLANDAIGDAVNDFILIQEQAINNNTELSVEYWKAAQVAIADLAEGATEPLTGMAGDVDRASEEYQRAFNNYLSTVRTRTTGNDENTREIIEFDSVGRIRTGDFLVNWIEENQLAEAISRVGEGAEKATADFATTLGDLVDSDLTDAFESLANVTASEAENLAVQLENARDDLEALGFDRNITNAEFSSLLSDAQSSPIDAETLSNFLNASVLLDDISNKTAEVTETLDSYRASQLSLSRQYMTDAQMMTSVTDELTQAFGEYGLAVPTSREQFLALAQSIDVSTEAGQQAFDALDDVSSSFDTMISQIKALDESIAALVDDLDVASGSTEQIGITFRDADLALQALGMSGSTYLGVIKELEKYDADGLESLADTLGISFGKLEDYIRDLITAQKEFTGDIGSDTSVDYIQSTVNELRNTINTLTAEYFDGVLPSVSDINEMIAAQSPTYSGQTSEIASMIINAAGRGLSKIDDLNAAYFDAISDYFNVNLDTIVDSSEIQSDAISEINDYSNLMRGRNLTEIELSEWQAHLESGAYAIADMKEWIDNSIETGFFSDFNQLKTELQANNGADELRTLLSAITQLPSAEQELSEALAQQAEEAEAASAANNELAAAISKRQQLEDKLLRLQGDQAAIRAAEIEQLKELEGWRGQGLVSLQEQINALQDYNDTVLELRDAIGLTDVSAQDAMGIFSDFGNTVKSIVESVADLTQSELNDWLTDTGMAAEDFTNSLEPLVDIYNEQGTALERAQTAASDALSTLSRSIDAQKDVLREAYEEQSEALNDSLTDARDSLSELESVAKSLKDAVSETANEPTVMRRALLDAAQAEIARLAASGELPSSEDLEDLLSRVTADNTELFGSGTAFDVSQAKLQNNLFTLSELADDQLSEAEQQIALSEQQLEALEDTYNQNVDVLEAQLESYQQQLDVLNGIDVSVMSVEEAVKAVESAIGGYINAIDSDPSTLDVNEEFNPYSDAVMSALADYREYNETGYIPNNISEILGTLVNAGIDSNEKLEDAYSYLPAYANGGTHTGGLALVGERGPEIVNMPFGAHVSTASQTRQMMDQSALINQIAMLEEKISNMASDTNAMYNLWRNSLQGNILYTYNVNEAV